MLKRNINALRLSTLMTALFAVYPQFTNAQTAAATAATEANTKRNLDTFTGNAAK